MVGAPARFESNGSAPGDAVICRWRSERVKYVTWHAAPVGGRLLAKLVNQAGPAANATSIKSRRASASGLPQGFPYRGECAGRCEARALFKTARQLGLPFCKPAHDGCAQIRLIALVSEDLARC